MHAPSCLVSADSLLLSFACLLNLYNATNDMTRRLENTKYACMLGGICFTCRCLQGRSWFAQIKITIKLNDRDEKRTTSAINKNTFVISAWFTKATGITYIRRYLHDSTACVLTQLQKEILEGHIE